LKHDIIVLQHPFYWYCAPALLKEWQDLVLEYGFAYGAGGDRLHGKLLLSAITTGAGRQTYGRDGINYFTVHELLAPVHQLSRFCGMRWLPPFVVYGTLQEGDEHFRAAAVTYRAALAGLRDGSLDVDHLPPDTLLNDAFPPNGVLPDAR
ncbi:MAG: NAD(P)H-dependent oxidoreductase, partial [bacterium]|nr:NAD(P)H-dependent oxidoreductase [bacterium]